jgi:tRNA threonylcarbamoyladenosine modification (KEOPS) complex Cgi121 subunit
MPITGSAAIKSSIKKYIINKGKMNIIVVKVDNMFHDFKPEFEG